MMCSVSFYWTRKNVAIPYNIPVRTLFPRKGWSSKGLCMIADERMIQTPTLENIYNQEIRDQEKLCKIEIT